MVAITINTNRDKRNPDNKILIENYSRKNYLSELKIQNNNITYCRYNYSDTLFFSITYYYNEKCCYYKRFRVGEICVSYYAINKSFSLKRRNLNIKIIIYNILFYSYFIYNKYYTNGNKKYYNSINSITSKKLFNCRDFHKIHSYI